MQYMLIFTEPAETFARREDPAEAPAYWGAWATYMGAVAQAGIMVNGDALHPPHTATTVRIRNGRREVQDGPYADVKEQLGGYIVIEVAGLDAALAWAAKAPSAEYGAVEVRPVLPPPVR
ncbi:YciI family protein [Hyphomonas sp.]|jgi:hypothetical protein|uniref:YciI family protein n=1 Tax=Hyphomonas sp. TaxID=87 RepID=UPI0025BBF19D|nr:YciI family protein [Hyphomonas sp.]